MINKDIYMWKWKLTESKEVSFFVRVRMHLRNPFCFLVGGFYGLSLLSLSCFIGAVLVVSE
jgi:hypothetical protein